MPEASLSEDLAEPSLLGTDKYEPAVNPTHTLHTRTDTASYVQLCTDNSHTTPCVIRGKVIQVKVCFTKFYLKRKLYFFKFTKN